MESEDQYKFDHASDMAGEYLTELGKTDLAILSREEWFEFLNVIIKAHYTAPPF